MKVLKNNCGELLVFFWLKKLLKNKAYYTSDSKDIRRKENKAAKKLLKPNNGELKIVDNNKKLLYFIFV